MVRKLTLDEVKKTFSDQKCTLISTEYIKARDSLQYICNCGSETIHTVTLAHFKEGQRCKDCFAKRMKETVKAKYGVDHIWEKPEYKEKVILGLIVNLINCRFIFNYDIIRNMSWDLLVHSTKFDNLQFIKDSKGFYVPEEKDKKLYSARFIYTSYYSDDIDMNKYITKFWSFYHPIKILIRSEILRDVPFMGCKSMNFGLGCLLTNINGNGNYLKTPNLSKLKNLIKKEEVKTYVSTHELLHPYIPLKYIVCILAEMKDVSKIKNIFPDIPVFSIPSPNDSQKNYFYTQIEPYFKLFGNKKNNFVIEKESTSKPLIALEEMKEKFKDFAITIGYNFTKDWNESESKNIKTIKQKISKLKKTVKNKK